jgi:hypothetical protein
MALWSPSSHFHAAAALALTALPSCGGDNSEATGDSNGSSTTVAPSTTAPTTTAPNPTDATTDPTTESGPVTTTTDPVTTTSSDATTDDPTTGATTTDTGSPSSPGCGLAPPDPAGGVNVMIDAGPAGDGVRRFYLRPADYDPEVPHRLILGFPGTNWVGEMIAALPRPRGRRRRSQSADEIFVYPDPLWRDFEGWGKLGGWLLGPHAAPADGDQDLVFTEAVLDYMEIQLLHRPPASSPPATAGAATWPRSSAASSAPASAPACPSPPTAPTGSGRRPADRLPRQHRRMDHVRPGRRPL